MNVYMFTGPLMLVLAAVILCVLAWAGGLAFWRWRTFDELFLPLVSTVLILGGLTVTGAGYGPTVQEWFSVSDVRYQSKYENYMVSTTDGRSISVPTEVGRGLSPGDEWTCRIHRVPVTKWLIGNCTGGHAI